jgi:hypothetical protein
MRSPPLTSACRVENISEDMLRLLIGRIEASRGDEQLIYRECELDEVWRLIEYALAAAPADKSVALAALRSAVVVAHDCIGVEGDTAAAAGALREALLLARALDRVAS